MRISLAVAAALVAVLATTYVSLACPRGGGYAPPPSVSITAVSQGAYKADETHVVCAPVLVATSTGRASPCSFAVTFGSRTDQWPICVTASLASVSSGTERARFSLTSMTSRSWSLSSLPTSVDYVARPSNRVPTTFAYTVSWSNLTNASMGGRMNLVLEIKTHA